MRSMRSKELPEELRDRPGRGWKNILPTLTPLFGATRALFWLPGCLNKLNGEGWSSLVRAVTKNPKNHSTQFLVRERHMKGRRGFSKTLLKVSPAVSNSIASMRNSAFLWVFHLNIWQLYKRNGRHLHDVHKCNRKGWISGFTFYLFGKKF